MSKAKRNTSTRDKHRAQIKHGKPNCHICGNAIDYDLPHTDERSFVVDHVIPLDKGGLDVLSNKKAAHRRCNSKKRARLVAPIVRRSGSLS